MNKDETLFRTQQTVTEEVNLTKMTIHFVLEFYLIYS